MSNEDMENRDLEKEETPEEEPDDDDVMRQILEKEDSEDDENIPVYDLTLKVEQKEESDLSSSSSSDLSEEKTEKIEEPPKELIDQKAFQITSEGDFGAFPEDTPEPEPVSPSKNEEEVNANPLKLIEKYAIQSRLETQNELIHDFTDDLSYSQLDAKRMTYVQYKKIASIVQGDDPKLSGKPTCMVVVNEFVAIGNTQGVIRLFDFVEDPYKSPIMHKDLLGKKVTSIDIKKGGNHLIAGYENGAMLLWDLGKWSMQKLDTSVHSAAVLSVKFLKGTKLRTISSDAAGEVQVCEFSKALLGTNVKANLVNRDRCVFNICPLLPNPLHPSKSDEYSPIATAGNNGVRIILTNLTFNVVWSYKSPISPKKALPYIDWGRGPLPGNEQCESLILAIAWERMIQLIEIIDAMTPDSDNYIENGYYECDDEINSLCWLAEGVISILTSKKQFMLLHTSSFAPGKFQGYQKTDKRYPELEEPYQITEEILSSTIKIAKPSPGDTGDQNDRTTYHQTVVPSGNRILCACDSSLLCGKLYAWDEYMEEQKKNNSWKVGLQICLKMYTGKFVGFAGLPDQPELRQAVLRPYLKNFLLDYLKQIVESGKKDGTQAAVAIEFCLAISAVSYLFEDMRSFFSEIQQETMYIEALEPFILAGKFRREEIPEELVQIIVEYYKEKPNTLERILLNLNLKGQDLTALSELCLKKKLFFLHIYLKTIGNTESEYLEPLIVLHNELKARHGSYFPLEKIFENSNQVEGSGNFIGYVMMWYIDMCFKRKKFPKRYIAEDMQISLYARPIIVYLILNWLITGKGELCTLKDLALVDPACLLGVFKNLFEDRELREIMIEPSKYITAGSVTARSYNELLKKLESTISDLSEKDEEEAALLNLYYKFLAQVATQPGIAVPPESCIEAAKRLSSVNKEWNGNPIDRKEYEALILAMLQNCPTLSKEQIDYLINVFSSRSYTEVLIYLRELKKDYIKCFETFLDSRDPQARSRIFPWLATIHDKLEEGSLDYLDLQDAIYDKLETLMSLNIKKTTDIVDTWFKHQHEKVIGKLAKKPEIQLEYVERILDDKESEIEAIMKEQSISVNETEEYSQYYRLLELHIELLCDLSPEKVLPAIKKKYYPTTECLSVCKRKKHSPAVAYLLKRAGDFTESLNTYLKILQKIGADLIDETKKDSMDANIGEFNLYFNAGLKVCLKNAKIASGDETSQSLWFGLLDYLYEIMLKVFSIKNQNTSSLKSVVFTAMFNKLSSVLNNCIKELLTKMMVYVGFPTIMTRLSEKHGELEIESFKEMFTSMLSSYFYNEKILETASKIISNDVVAQFKALTGMKCKAFPVSATICAKCDRPINQKSEANIAIFECGHVYHSTCLKGVLGCYACTYKEVKAQSLDQLVRRNVGKKVEEEESEEPKSNEKEDSDNEEEEEPEQKQKVATKGVKDFYLARFKLFERMRVKSFAISMKETNKMKNYIS